MSALLAWLQREEAPVTTGSSVSCPPLTSLPLHDPMATVTNAALSPGRPVFRSWPRHLSLHDPGKLNPL